MLGTSRILEKGPEYLRKQIEREREAKGRVSAAERLAATKPNYVKSPQVSLPSSGEPLTCPGAGGNTQVSSPSSGELFACPGAAKSPLEPSPSPQKTFPHPGAVRGPRVSAPSPQKGPPHPGGVRGPQVSAPSPQKGPPHPGAVRGPRVNAPSSQNLPPHPGAVRGPQVSSPSSQKNSPLHLGALGIPSPSPRDAPTPRVSSVWGPDQDRAKDTTDGGNEGEEVTDRNLVKRNSSKNRPDSILLYRQKCELQRSSGTVNQRMNSLRKKYSTDSAASSGKNSERTMHIVQIHLFDEEGTQMEDEDEERGVVMRRGQDSMEEGLEPERARKSVARSHSDISSRYSKCIGDFDTFFTYCGLEEDVIQTMGRENFSSRSDEHDLSYAKIRSVSVATSDGEISHTSGDMDGLQEEEMRGSRQQGSSVIERNARVIKWLYSCKNASQSGKTLRDLD